ncbi:hypothetical protein N7U66_01525 [Lacinutrix neustonica]|uniref:T9SS C-terminal target domain-containing protein n=1 Tax=Lacinutrix neustonica TaxID=2980107 RepID=A0A9E8MVT7_9FLAO|nr:hypothetical protein [Lacinutrix neustonica]WAC02423.1 hypothetical protein N7U66_01525 [Lacinutrix neustonica]
MKSLTKQIAIGATLLFMGTLYAQQEKGITGEENWLNSWTEFQPKAEDYGSPTQILTGNITQDTKLTKRETYLLSGSVFVTDSTTLTIEPGTVILGDFATNGSLTISKGATLIAEGSETDPIIFTSNRGVKKEGDWGGLFILGDAPTNKFGNASAVDFGLKPSSFAYTSYGGDNAESNYGILKYVRIEYAGKRTKNHGYYNGLTLAGVGNATVLENVMISYCGGNAFNILGGAVNLNKMISYKSKGTDYTFNYGTQSTLSNSLAIRSPYVSGVNGSRCLSVSSYITKEEVDFTKKQTAVTAQNLTLLNLSKDLQADINVGLVNEAIYVSNHTSLAMSKSVISGFNPAAVFEKSFVLDNDTLEKIKFTNMYFNNCNGNIFIENNSNNEDLENWYGNSAFFNVYSKTSDSETFIDSKNKRYPDFRLRINKIVASTED